MVDPKALADAQAEHARRKEGRIESVLAEAMLGAADRFERDEVVALPDGFRSALQEALEDVWRGSALLMAGQAKAAWGFEVKEDESLFDRIIQAFLEAYGAVKIARIADVTRDQILRIVQDGIRSGDGATKIAADMRAAVPMLSSLRAHVIARTETHQASNFSNRAIAKTATIPLVKRWVSVSDHRTRDFGEGDGTPDEFSHRAMNGVTAEMDMPYMVPTKFGAREPLMFPGDPNGSPGNVIMCRCVEVYERSKDGT